MSFSERPFISFLVIALIQGRANVGNDAYLTEDRLCRVGCEALCKGKHVVLAGEITSLKPAMSPMNYTLCAVVLSTQELQRIEHTISLLDGYRSRSVRFSCLSFTKGHGIIPDMKNKTMKEDWETYSERLRHLPFIKDAAISKVELRIQTGHGTARPDAILRIKTLRGDHEFFVEMKRTHLTYALADGLTVHARRAGQKPWILFTLHVPRKIGRYLGELGINYVDRAGNCRLQIGTDYVAVIEGQKPIYAPAPGRGIGVPGYRVLFTILAKPGLLNVPVRTLADAAAVSKTTAAETIARLQRDGLVSPDPRQRRIVDPRALLNRWMVGYETARTRMIMGRFRTQDPNPAALEERLEKELGNDIKWAWGGGAAAMRITKHYRGEETVLHVLNPTADLPRRLKALPAADGPFMIQRTPAKTAFEGAVPQTVHPLLVYAELMASGNPRAREAAIEIRERYLNL
jgi:hypothetical protein